MDVKTFVDTLIKVSNMKTYYVKGGFGIVLNANGKKKVINQYDYNKVRADKINALNPATFGFDCCGLIKGVLWGFKGDLKKTYGGAEYASNGVPDVNEKGLLNVCRDIKDITGQNDCEIGDFLYLPGHCGIYLGNGNVIESTPSWANGVQVIEFSKRKWKACGKLPYIEYGTKFKIIPRLARYYLKQGNIGMEVYTLQRDLNYAIDAKLATDGIFGPKTKQALINFQTKHNLMIDGIYGPQSYNKMKEVLDYGD